MAEAQSNFDSIKLRKFNGATEEYSSWKRDLFSSMTIKGLGDIVKALEDPMPTEDNKKAEYKNRNALLYAYLVLALDDANARAVEISANEDGWKAWQIIKQKYERTDMLRRVLLRMKLYTLKLNSFEDMDQFLNAMAGIRKQLHDVEKQPISDSEAICAIFLRLPESYEDLGSTRKPLMRNLRLP